MGKFRINDLLNDPQPKAASEEARRTFKEINISCIDPSPNNKYGIRDITDMAANIEMVGLLHPLVVREGAVSGRYEIISGERRFRGLKLLVDDGKKEFEMVPCMLEVQKDDLLAELELLFANSETRDLTDYEKTYQAGRIKELLQEMKSRGYKFKGRMRDIVADILKVSPAQVGIMESINKNLAPDAKAEFSKGNMNITTAYEASRLPKDQQAEVVEDIKKKGGKVGVKDVAGKRKPPAKPSPPPAPASSPAPPPKTEPEPPPAKTPETMFNMLRGIVTASALPQDEKRALLDFVTCIENREGQAQ